MKELQDFSFLLDSAVSLILQVSEGVVDGCIDRRQLPVERFNPIFLLLVEEVFEVEHPVVASLDFGVLVLSLIIELLGQLVVELLDLLSVPVLVGLETLIDFLTLVNGVLLVVFDLLVDVFELLLEESFCLVPEPHHLIELLVDLLDLVVQALDLQVLLLSGVVHCF